MLYHLDNICFCLVFWLEMFLEKKKKKAKVVHPCLSHCFSNAQLFLCPLSPSHFVFAVQACSCCAGVSEGAATEQAAVTAAIATEAVAAAAATAEDQPDLDIGDTETGEVSCQQRILKHSTDTTS